MLKRRAIMAGALATAIIILGFAGPVRADSSVAGAESFIDSMAARAVEALAGKEVSREERVQRFRVLLREYFAIETIGRWVLGRYWRKATDNERSEYLALFEDLIIATYVDRFTEYSGENLSVTKSVMKGDKDIVVFSRLERPSGGTPLRVDWRVRNSKDGSFKIVDVMVEGVSMGQTQRSEFASVIRKNGGKVSGLLSVLRKRLKGDA